MDYKICHLEMIQRVIERMAKNSFLLKGWNVILVSALFALAAKDANCSLVIVAIFPSVAFWSLDAYFVRQERLFRRLYRTVAQADESNIDFFMDTSSFVGEESLLGVMFSATLSIFHGSILGTIIVVLLVVNRMTY